MTSPIPAPQKAEEPQDYGWVFAIGADGRAVACNGNDTVAVYGLPKSSGIPATARAILNIVPEKKTSPLTDKQKQQAESIGRAVNRLNSNEPRLGCADWRP